jgi:uncharacterized membrane protein YsdA (DUF1294 family)
MAWNAGPACAGISGRPAWNPQLALAVVGASVFLLGLAAYVATNPAPWWLLPWYLVLSVATFLLYGWDKVSASGGHRRTPGSTLNGLALLGGWPGGWIAQHAWRHKSRKTSFQVAFWTATLVNVGALMFFIVVGLEALR